MGAFARVIVEERDGQWTAYFGDEPHNAASGTRPTEAMQRLLRTMGKGEFQEADVKQITGASREGHLEFLAPFRPHHGRNARRRS